MTPLPARPSLPAALLLCALAAGCASPAGTSPDTPAAPRAGKPAAALKGSTIQWEDLQPTLAEVGGGVALEELVLDRTLADRLKSLQIDVTREQIDAERAGLTRALEADASLSPDQAAQQLERLRRTRGLGPARFDALLLRNARLRALARAQAAAEVTPTTEQLAQEERIANGDRFRVRIFSHPSQSTCSQVRESILKDDAANTPTTPATTSARFAEAAVRQSTDPSARAGGLLDGISPADPAIPDAIRQSLATLQDGQVSPVLVSGRGFALVLMESRVPPARTLPPQEVEQRLRARLERVAMERLARRLIAESGVTVLDPSLAWSWENR
ncbi:MAG: peptidylprolyl isomerase [Phycisphaerales bacterium]